MCLSRVKNLGTSFLAVILHLGRFDGCVVYCEVVKKEKYNMPNVYYRHAVWRQNLHG